MEENKKIEELLLIAFDEGIEKAIKIAKEKQDPYLLDEFHDRLIEEIKKRKQ
jgi:hypothetical protein